MWIQSLGREDPLELQMATHSNILAWEIPWSEELGGLQSIELQRVRASAHTHTHTHTRKQFHSPSSSFSSPFSNHKSY